MYKNRIQNTENRIKDKKCGNQKIRESGGHAIYDL
jgi:hypothetical protein